MNEIKVNDIIEFGRYPQTKDGDTFKVEPIKWRVLEINNGEALILSEKILDTHMFSEESNNYADSEIRRWLNNEFYNKAFNEEEKSRIVITNVDNSESSTYPDDAAETSWFEADWNSGKNIYACENTDDKIFLLSQQEITKENYGFDNNSLYESKIIKQGTDYARSKGLWDERYYRYGLRNGLWWLRSPRWSNSGGTYSVSDNGYTYHVYNVSYINHGVVPALKIKLI